MLDYLFLFRRHSTWEGGGVQRLWDILGLGFSVLSTLSTLGEFLWPYIYCTVAIVENWFKNCTLFTVYSTLSTVHCIEYSTTMSTVQ